METYVPQAISQWYLGSGATVGYSTITGIAALGDLLDRRDQGQCDFRVFPFEDIEAGVHVLAEVFPAIWAKPPAGWSGEHERDALRTVIGLASTEGELLRFPSAVENHFPGALARVQEEGWITGVF